jgi:hypothetical protein
VKRFLQSYGILVLSLLALFASGVFVGRMTAPGPRRTEMPPAGVPADADAWVAAASQGLVKDLKLDEAQQQKVRQQLEPVAAAIFTDQERALFQMHLRLLELHDTLAKEGSLSGVQLKRLGVSRAKLKELIIRKFPRMVRENPSLVVGDKIQK